MAISPQQLNEAFMTEVDHYENRIDSYLSNKKTTLGGSVTVSVPSGMSEKHFQILKERYINVGWKDVKWNFDQREGNWLEFKS